MADKYAGPTEDAMGDSMDSFSMGAVSGAMASAKKKEVKRPSNWNPMPKLKATDAQMRDYERNKPVNTPAGRARYADKAPKIDVRKSYPE